MALDEAHASKARGMIDRAARFLISQQDEKSGGWSVPQAEGQPNLPAITGLVVTGLARHPRLGPTNPAVQRGVSYMLSFRQPDGGVYDRVLPSYNTAICLSALATINRGEACGAVEGAVGYLRSLQWSEEALVESGDTGRVGPDHPFYGGVGYGRNGRPDNSNLNVFAQAMHDAGVPANDPAFERALVFLKRTQMDDRINPMEYAEGSRQGGFIYSTAENAQTLGQGQSMAGSIEETLSDGSAASRLRAYGSMTYAGFKTMIYADLDPADERVQAAYAWLRRNYSVKENPGVGTDGLYYYFLTMSRALDAWGPGSITLLDASGAPSDTRDWGNDLVARLGELQAEDGGFTPVDDRWMEDNRVLITAYALLALQHVLD